MTALVIHAAALAAVPIRADLAERIARLPLRAWVSVRAPGRAPGFIRARALRALVDPSWRGATVRLVDQGELHSWYADARRPATSGPPAILADLRTQIGRAAMRLELAPVALACDGRREHWPMESIGTWAAEHGPGPWGVGLREATSDERTASVAAKYATERAPWVPLPGSQIVPLDWPAETIRLTAGKKGRRTP